jgi:hypothetical protein
VCVFFDYRMCLEGKEESMGLLAAHESWFSPAMQESRLILRDFHVDRYLYKEFLLFIYNARSLC